MLLIRHPIAGVAAVALLIGLWLITIGVIRFVTAFEEYEHRMWHGIAGLVEILAGTVIVATPEIGFATLAVLVGIGFILNGIAVAALGMGNAQDVREEASRVAPTPSRRPTSARRAPLGLAPPPIDACAHED